MRVRPTSPACSATTASSRSSFRLGHDRTDVLAIAQDITRGAIRAVLRRLHGVSIGRCEHVLLLENRPAGVRHLVDPVKFHVLPRSRRQTRTVTRPRRAAIDCRRSGRSALDPLRTFNHIDLLREADAGLRSSTLCGPMRAVPSAWRCSTTPSEKLGPLPSGERVARVGISQAVAWKALRALDSPGREEAQPERVVERHRLLGGQAEQDSPNALAEWLR